MGNKYTIRHATLDDLDAISEVELLCFPPAEAATKQSFKSRLEVYPDCFWLLEVDGKIVSIVNGMTSSTSTLTDDMYSDASLHNPNGEWQMIFGVETIPEYQKMGLMEILLNKVIEDTKARGKKGLVLTCKDKLIHYYAKFGFKNEGVSRSEHGGALWYQMRLTF